MLRVLESLSCYFRFLEKKKNYSLKSANETKFWLGLLRDSGKANKERTIKLLEETREIANILASSILTLKGKK